MNWDTLNYAMVGSIPHAIAFDMCHVVCEGMPHDHVVCILAMWYAFLTMGYVYGSGCSALSTCTNLSSCYFQIYYHLVTV